MPSIALVNIAAEQACLGACLVSADAAELVCTESRQIDYTRDTHRSIYRTIYALVSRGTPVDQLTVAQSLPSDVPSTLIVDLVEAVPSAANVRHYLALLRQATMRRTAHAACQRTLDRLTSPHHAVSETITALMEDLEAATGADDHQTIKPTAVTAALKIWMQSVETGVKPTRIPTHLTALNRCLGGGMAPGRLYYLGARPSVGKTSLALDIARHASSLGHACLIVSLEMPEIDGITTRLLAQQSHVSELTMRGGMFTDAEYPRMVAGYSKLAEQPLWVTERATSIDAIQRCAARWPFTPRLDLLIVDYLQLVRGPKTESRRVEIEEISRALKLLSVSIGSPVLCISALRRRENDENEPTMSDLKETGELEYDADSVWLLHRGFGAESAKLIVAKNKYGPVGTIPLLFRKQCVTFEQAPED